MAKLMWIAGILLAAAGVALGLMVFASPTAIVSWGLTPEVAALLLVGGILSIGLGGVIHAVEMRVPAPAEIPAYVPPSAEEAAPIPEFGRRTVEVAAAAAVEEVSEPVRETIEALEQARRSIEEAFEPKAPEEAAAPSPEIASEPEIAQPETLAEPEEVIEDLVAEAEAEPEPEPETAEEDATAEGQLYVVEERFVRARPARILSDGTVEAETEEGWMRFENLEHLDEYLDAMTTPAPQT